MNESFAAEPLALRGHLHLKFLLEKFGPLTGRYLAAYPKNWKDQVIQLNAECGDVERERIKVLLRRAREQMQIVSGASLPFDETDTWIGNVIKLLESRPKRLLHGAVISSLSLPERYHDVFELDDLQLPPTAEERIAATPDEFLRVARTLLLTSAELGLVDPFIDPSDRYVRAILDALIAHAAKGCCQSIRIWTRASVALAANSENDLRKSLESLVPTKTQNRLVVELNLLDDGNHADRMHGRYLLSCKGGIRFDQGFQQLPATRKVDVSPLSSSEILRELWQTYFEGVHSWPAACKPIIVTRTVQ